MKTASYSILTPFGKNPEYKNLSKTAFHDLGLDAFVKTVTEKPKEQTLLLSVLSAMTSDPEVAAYRAQVFSDIRKHPDMCKKIMETLDKIDFLKSYHFRGDYEEKAGIWDMMHRLTDIEEYILCVESIYNCLKDADLNSPGLLGLREYVNQVYTDHAFAEMKADVERLRAHTDSLKSVTVGINLNKRFEAESIGIVSINNKSFNQMPVIGEFAAAMAGKDLVRDTLEWDGNYKYHPFSMGSAKFLDFMNKGGKMAAISQGPLYALNTLATVPDNDFAQDMLRGVDKQVGHLLTMTGRKMKEVLDKYIGITIGDMTDLIPEFTFYILFANYIDKIEATGISFCTPEVTAESRVFRGKGIFNLKLIGSVKPEEIVRNDFTFDDDHRVFILTGANRGGKTTITQAVGQYFVLAQGGIPVPGESFEYNPVDGIYTHFPADEDKTLDLGRLGEECKRFREIYGEATKESLVLLNETFSTTSFEEGYYIAKDSIRALLKKGIRTVYNTHMHKLGFDLPEFHREETDGKAASVIVETREGVRSFKVKEALPEGSSYAKDIAEKYGVTYELLEKIQ